MATQDPRVFPLPKSRASGIKETKVHPTSKGRCHVTVLGWTFCHMSFGAYLEVFCLVWRGVDIISQQQNQGLMMGHLTNGSVGCVP